MLLSKDWTVVLSACFPSSSGFSTKISDSTLQTTTVFLTIITSSSTNDCLCLVTCSPSSEPSSVSFIKCSTSSEKDFFSTTGASSSMTSAVFLFASSWGRSSGDWSITDSMFASSESTVVVSSSFPPSSGFLTKMSDSSGLATGVFSTTATSSSVTSSPISSFSRAFFKSTSLGSSPSIAISMFGETGLFSMTTGASSSSTSLLSFSGSWVPLSNPSSITVSMLRSNDSTVGPSVSLVSPPGPSCSSNNSEWKAVDVLLTTTTSSSEINFQDLLTLSSPISFPLTTSFCTIDVASIRKGSSFSTSFSAIWINTFVVKTCCCWAVSGSVTLLLPWPFTVTDASSIVSSLTTFPLQFRRKQGH